MSIVRYTEMMTILASDGNRDLLGDDDSFPLINNTISMPL